MLRLRGNQFRWAVVRGRELARLIWARWPRRPQLLPTSSKIKDAADTVGPIPDRIVATAGQNRVLSRPSQACFSVQPIIVLRPLWELFMRDSWYYSVPEG